MNGKLIGEFTSNNSIVDLKSVQVISKGILSCDKESLVYYSLDGKRYFQTKVTRKQNEIDFHNLVARFIKFDFDFSIKVYQGIGYIGEANEKWNKIFEQNQYWVGGDGLFSFNLTGLDNYQAKDNDVTLCVFGDTFNCTLSNDNVRLSPLAMPNNSYCEITESSTDNPNIQFHINEDEMGHCKAYLEPDNELMYEGTLASNLVNYNPENKQSNYLSGINPKKNIELEFIFTKKYEIDFIKVFNYFVESEKDYFYQNRGVKEVDIYLDNKFFIKTKIEKASFEQNGNNSTIIKINKKCKSIKFIISNQIGRGNYLGANRKEGFFGLNKIYFYQKDGSYLKDIKVNANSEFLKKDKHSWFWLQDGVVLNNKLYSLPFVVSSDPTQPEGFQFKIEGISFTETSIEDGKINFGKTKQKMTNLYQKSNDKTITFGGAFYNNTFSSKEEKADGYIYIYGYMSDKNHFEKGNQLIVARTKEENISQIDEWTFFDGKEFNKDIQKVAPLLSHISCEFSLHYDDGKYIVVFTYDVQSRYVCYALSSTPYGPFDEIRNAYVCPEDLCPHMYIYNAKAHPHLSKKNDILVSYNINTSNFSENINYGRTYGPRFVNLKRIGGNNNEN